MAERGRRRARSARDAERLRWPVLVVVLLLVAPVAALLWADPPRDVPVVGDGPAAAAPRPEEFECRVPEASEPPVYSTTTNVSWTPAPESESWLVVRVQGVAQSGPLELETELGTVQVDGMPFVNARLTGARHPGVLLEKHVDGANIEWRADGPAVARPGMFRLDGFGGLDPVYVGRSSFAGTLDLGRLPPLGEGPVLAAGRVEDDRGEPIVGAAVHAGIEFERHTHYGPKATTGADGRFEIRAHVDGIHALHLRVQNGWALEHDAAVAVGATDVVLTASPTCTLSGSVAVRHIPLDQLEILVRGPGIGRDGVRYVGIASSTTRSGTCTFAAQEAFAIAGLAPGRYDVQLRRLGSSKPLAEYRDWDVSPPASALPALVVAEETRDVHVLVRGPDGAPAAGARVWLRDVDDRGGWGKALVADASGRIVSQRSEPSLEVAAHAVGCSFEFVTSSDDRVELQLREVPETPVTIRMPEIRVDVPDDARLVMSLNWIAAPTVPRETLWPGDEEGDVRADEDVELPIAANGVAEGVVATPGWYQVWKTIWRGGRRQGSSHPGGPIYVRVDGTGQAVVRTLGSEWSFGRHDFRD